MPNRKYLEFGSANVHLPMEMIGLDRHHHEHLYRTLTKKDRLSRHNGIPSIRLSTHKGNRAIKAVKGKLITLNKKIKEVKAAALHHKSKVHEVHAAHAEVKMAVMEHKKRGRKPLSEEQKEIKAHAKREAMAHKKAAKTLEKNAKKEAKAAHKASLPKKRRGRPAFIF